MSVTIDEIANYLTQMDLNFQKESDHKIETGFTGDKGVHVSTVIALTEGGDYMKIVCWSKANLRIEECDDSAKSEIYKWMLHQNHRLKMGNWEYNPLDNDSHFAIEVMVEDGTITFEQFKRFISIIFTVSDDMATLMKIVEGMSHQEAIQLEDKDSKAELKAKLQALMDSLEDSEVLAGI